MNLATFQESFPITSISNETKNLLIEIAFHNTLKKLSSYGNTFSSSIKEALYDLIQTLTNMASGEAEPLYYVSSLDPGLGKTTSIIEWTKVLLQIQIFHNVGVIIGFDRHEQIKSFIQESDLPSSSYSVRVSVTNDPLELNSYGLKDINKSQVLLTTKDQIRIKSKGRSFSNIKELSFKGRIRQVRIWDESLLVGKPLFLPRPQMGSLYNAISKHDKNLFDQVQHLLADLSHFGDGYIYTIPDFDIELDPFRKMFSKEPYSTKQLAETFWHLLGKPITLRRTSHDLMLVDCIEDLPDDFKPCLVTDASARVRGTYKLHYQERKDIKFLKAANKDYSNLTCHVWEKGSGKTAYTKQDFVLEVAREAATVIDSRPEERFLVIHHKEEEVPGKSSLASFIKNYMASDPSRVDFIHYGIHTATNRYSDIPNVLLLAINFYEIAQYEAIGRAAAGRPTSQGLFTKQELEQVRIGEIGHHTLQAVCRSNIRRCIGSSCPKANLWVIAHPTTGLPKSLSSLFPGCKAGQWKTNTTVLPEKQRVAIEFVKKQIDEGTAEVIYLSDIIKALNTSGIQIRDNPTFKRDIHKGPFREFLDSHGYILEGKGKQARFTLMFQPEEDRP